MKKYLERCVELSKIAKTYDGLRDMCVKEQFIDMCPKDVAIYLREKNAKDLKELGQYAEQYLVARDRQLISVTSGLKQNHETDRKLQQTEDLRCFKCNQVGHKASECPNNNFRGKSTLECYNCHKFGHIAKDCKVKRPTQKEAKYAAAALLTPVEVSKRMEHNIGESSGEEDGKIALKSGGTMDIISASCLKFEALICQLPLDISRVEE